MIKNYEVTTIYEFLEKLPENSYVEIFDEEKEKVIYSMIVSFGELVETLRNLESDRVITIYANSGNYIFTPDHVDDFERVEVARLLSIIDKEYR